MSISIRSLSELSIGELPDELDLSQPSNFRELLRDLEAQFIYLIELNPYNADKANTATWPAPLSTVAIGEFDFEYRGGLETVYISDVGYSTRTGETPANTTYLPLTSNPFQFEVSIMSGDEFRGGQPSFGSIRIENGDAELDAITDYYWGGRSVSVYAGQPGFTRSQFEKIFEGICTQPEYDEDQITINIADKSRILETEFQQDLYEGTGGLEGGADIEGSPKPLAYGECLNVSPVLIDAANLIYQVHDGSMESVDAVYDKGVALTSGGDVADITAASVSSGQFKTQLSGGYIKLGSSPVGRITADIKGDNNGGYISNIGAIVQRIVRTKLGSRSFSPATIDGAGFNRIDDAITGKVGIYVSDKTDAQQMLDMLITPVHGYWTFTRQGILTAGVIDAPGTPTFTIDQDQIEQIEVLDNIAPAWRISLGYARSWTQQSDDDIASAASTAFKTFIQEEYRKIILEDRNQRTKTAAAVEREFSSLFVDASDAADVLSRLESIYGVQRKKYQVRVKNLIFRVCVGDTVSLKMPRFGLDNGKSMLIVRASEDAETQTTILELWG